MKTALAIRHVPYEGIAGYRAPIEAAGYAIDRIDVGDPGFASRDLNAPDLLILRGGPMGVYETEANPWMNGEIGRVTARLARDKPTLGVCLGSQILAAALGARVYSGAAKEVGFAPLDLCADAGPLRHLTGVPVLHWHGDSFDLPERTERLASSSLYLNQAFRRGRNILALQFHAEMGEDERFFKWVANGADYLAEAGIDAAAITAAHAAHGSEAAAAGRAMMAEWLARL